MTQGIGIGGRRARRARVLADAAAARERRRRRGRSSSGPRGRRAAPGRSRGESGGSARTPSASGVLGGTLGLLASTPAAGTSAPRSSGRRLIAVDARQRDAAHLCGARRALLGAQRRREHRARGDDAHRRVLRDLGLGRDRQLGARARSSRSRAAASLALVYAFFAIHLRTDQIIGGTAVNFLALGITGYLFVDVYGTDGTPRAARLAAHPRRDDLARARASSRRRSASSTCSCGSRSLSLALTYVVVFRTPLGLRIRSVGEHPRAADAVGISVYKTRYAAVTLSGHALRDGRGIPLDRLRALLQREHDGGARLHRPRRAHLRQVAPGGAFGAALLFGFSSALAQRLGTIPHWSSYAVLFQALPVRPDPRRGRRRDRPLDPPRRGGTPVCEAVTTALRSRCSLGLAAVAAVPAAVALRGRPPACGLLDAVWAIPPAVVCGLAALLFARGARGRIRWTLERAGGGGQDPPRAASSGSPGICVALSASIAVGFYELLSAPRGIGRQIRSTMAAECSRSATASARRASARASTTAQVELATKIRAKYIRALEDEQFEVLPDRARTSRASCARTRSSSASTASSTSTSTTRATSSTGFDDMPQRRPRAGAGALASSGRSSCSRSSGSPP